MNKFFLVFQYFRYLLHARDEHSLHSPFAYTFYTTLIQGKKSSPDFEKIEALRKKLKYNHNRIEVTDLGAGSGVNNARFKTIASICKNAEKKPNLAQIIYRIIQQHKPAVVLDLGTSLGLTTLYEAKANPSAYVYTFEGCTNTAEIAAKNFMELGVQNVELVQGNIDATLPQVLNKVSSVDFVFFDANHRYSPTINYFLQCMEKANEDSIFIFDDIYWSVEMKKAWMEIKRHSSVGMTMDLFFIGIVFFRKKQPVQHFILR